MRSYVVDAVASAGAWWGALYLLILLGVVSIWGVQVAGHNIQDVTDRYVQFKGYERSGRSPVSPFMWLAGEID